ncbi:mechanosensitive ion channel domain-containing protein [Schaalia sp. HMT-172]|uniref:mechanosensitive ion channel domain-containing protein n=2 Tax=Actinomycetaceae TaxID=2049 RepID=UPI00272CC1F3|nr:mechanosensitive ion channel domain-containing protein [Schaalia sp. HMT-172]WLD77827.1 mechanosensitive ion channel [Schaalia sp. HMT-172]
MTTIPVLGALAQASDTLSRVAADPQSGAEAAVATTIDFTLLILGPIIGAFVGVVVSVVFAVLARKALAKSATASSILARVRRPLHLTLATWGAWVGLGIALVNPNLSDWNGSSVTTFLMHILLIAGLACLTWMGYAAAWVFEDAAKARQASDRGRSRRFETQAQVLRRLTQGIVVVVGMIAIIGTFEAARQAMTTVLASAGVLSVIGGLAAQQTLGNVFAGLQLAFTDAIRVGDVVVAGDKHETGSVEEITLSYVVVRIWDERRLIIPCRYFTQTPFENWTRRAAAQLGTVELKLDWSAPMTLIRTKVEQLLTATDLWDGRTWAVQITDSDEYTVTVRILVSAANSGNLNDLRAYLREQVISWIVTDEPWARPAQRIEPRETVTVEKDMSREHVARLAAELAGISGTNEAVAATGSPSSHGGGALRAAEGSAAGGAASLAGASGAERVREQPKDAAHAARMVAARRKAKRARRRAMADRQRELAEGGAPVDETQVISKSALRKIIEAAGNPNPQLTQTLTATSIGRGERFFSGSAEAEERAAALAGPGEEAYAEREADARRAQDRREGRNRREALDPEATVALAAVGVEPVEPDQPAEAAAEEPAEAQSAAGDAVAANTEAPASDGGVAEQREPANGPADTAAPANAEDSSNTDDAAGGTAAGAQVADAEPEEDASAQVAEAVEETAPADVSAPAEVPAPADGDAHEAAQASSDGEEPASRAAAEDAPQGAPAEAASEDEQATTPIPARETSVKQPVQVPPPARTGRPVMTDTVQALAPALVPPPEPTPAEMAASLADEETPDEPVVHPGWYAVAEEARLDAETRPTPKVEPAARVSIMDFFPAVAPTGAEADMLRAVTGQIPAVGSVETDAEGEPAAGDAEEKPEALAESGESDAEAADSAGDDVPDDQADAEDAVDAGADTADAADSAEGAEEADDQADAEDAVDAAADTAEAADSAEDAEEADDQADPEYAVDAAADTADAADSAGDAEEADDQADAEEATTVMTPVETAEAVTVDAEATQVLPTIEEQPALDETLVLPTADAAAKAADAASAAPDGSDEVEPATASAKKAPAKKAAAKKAQTAKKGGKKASSSAKKAVTEDEDKAENASESAAAKDAKAPAKKTATKKANAKKGSAKKASAKKAATKKTSTAKSATAK